MNIYETFFLFLYEDINRMVVTTLGHNCKIAKDEITKNEVVFGKLNLPEKDLFLYLCSRNSPLSYIMGHKLAFLEL